MAAERRAIRDLRRNGEGCHALLRERILDLFLRNRRNGEGLVVDDLVRVRDAINALRLILGHRLAKNH